MKWKIVTDSGSNIREINNLPEGILFDIIPLTLHVEQKDFVDTPDLDIPELLDAVSAAKKSSSACPAPGVYAEMFEGAENVICFTLSSNLSGSFNSAELGKTIALEKNPDLNVHIFDSRTAGGEIDLLVNRAIELADSGKRFDEVISDLNTYHQSTHSGYMLQSIENLVKNGRVSKVVGSLVGLLNINLVGIRSAEGKIEMSNRARGEKRALKTFVKELYEQGYNGKKMEIAHVENRDLADRMANLVRETFPNAEINIKLASGLCSFYAERGGLIAGFEKN